MKFLVPAICFLLGAGAHATLTLPAYLDCRDKAAQAERKADGWEEVAKTIAERCFGASGAVEQ